MKGGRVICSVVGVAVATMLTGCASVMSGRHADVTFYSNVPDAHVTIRDKNGEEVANTNTPGTIAIKRKTGILFPAKYTATVAAPGYQAEEVLLRQKVNPWILGNVIFFHAGLVGLAVDNATGAAWRPRETTIYRELTPLQPSNRAVAAAEPQPDPNVQPAARFELDDRF